MISIHDTLPPVDVGRMLMELSEWEPYRPEGYPITDRFHNPWVVLDPISGATAYNVWCSMGRTDDASALRAALEELTAPKGSHESTMEPGNAHSPCDMHGRELRNAAWSVFARRQ